MSCSEYKPTLAIFDLGNVVFNIDWEPMFRMWSLFSGIPADVLKERAKPDATLEQFERNQISNYEFHHYINTLLGINLNYAEFCDGWNAIFMDENMEISRLLPNLKSSMRVVAYTNTNEIHVEAWSKRYAHILQHFDEIFISSKIGFRKPEHEGFSYVLKHCGVAASECIFFDDFEINILGAQQLGIRSVLVDTPSKVRETFLQMGIAVL